VVSRGVLGCKKRIPKSQTLLGKYLSISTTGAFQLTITHAQNRQSKPLLTFPATPAPFLICDNNKKAIPIIPSREKKSPLCLTNI
jgi:hypothetical protein